MLSFAWSIRAGWMLAILFYVQGAVAQVPTTTAEALAAIRDVSRFTPRQSMAKLEVLLAQTPPSASSLRGEILVALSSSAFFLGDFARASRFAKEAERLGEQTGSQVIVAKSLLAQAYARSRSYDESSSQQLIERASKLADDSADTALKVQASISLGESMADDGQPTRGLALIDRALSLARDSGDKLSIFIALRARAAQRSSAADYAGALRDVDELISEAKRSGIAARQARARLTESTIAAQAGNAERALTALTAAIPLLEACGADTVLAGSLSNLSDLYLQRRDYVASFKTSERAFRLAQRYGETDLANIAAFNRGISNIYLGHVAKGRQDAEASLKHTQDYMLPYSLLEYANALAHAGETDRAVQHYQRAMDLGFLGAERDKRKSYETLQQAYRYEQKQHDIAKLQNENLRHTIALREHQQQQWRWAAVATVALVLLALLGFFSWRARRKNRQLARQKQELTTANEKLQWQSEHDALTGLFNRRFFENYIGAGEKPGFVYLIDVDHFKRVNDTHGHNGGDAVLKEVAARLQSVLRSHDILVRWGGEEFLVYLPGVNNNAAAELAERMLHAVSAEPICADPTPIRVTISAGYCPTPVTSNGVRMNWEASVRIADAALYFAKQSGRNRACGMDEPVDLSPSLLEELEEDFGGALDANRIGARHITGLQLSAAA